MAFCAKCGTPVNDTGVCPNCGYVLPQNKRPQQMETRGNDTAAAGNHPSAPNPNPGAAMGGPGYGAPMGGPQGGPQGQPNFQGSQGYGAPNPGNAAPGAGPYPTQNQGGFTQQGYGMPNPNQPMGGPGYGPGLGGPQGQPYYGQPKPRTTSDFGNNLLQWFLGIFKKDPTEIFDKVAVSKSPVWAVYMAVYAFFGALAIACSAGSLFDIFGELGNLGQLGYIYREATFRCALVAFFVAFLFYVALMFLTSLIVWLLFMLLGKKLPFFNACNVTVVAYIPCILASVFSFICSFTVATSMIAMFVSSVATLATMILLYAVVNRICSSQKPVLWIYVAAQAVLKILTVIVAVIFLFIFGLILSSMIMSSINSYMYW